MIGVVEMERIWRGRGSFRVMKMVLNAYRW